MFLRILTQDSVTQADIDYSRILIHEFLKDFEHFYAANQQTFNLHCHCHLADQVERHGPMHEYDCFPFEGWFKNCEILHNGTTNISGQIANNLNEKIKAHFEQQDIIIDKEELRAFVDKLSKRDWSNKIHLQDPVRHGSITSLKSPVEKCLIKEAFRVKDEYLITYSYKAVINNTRNFDILVLFIKNKLAINVILTFNLRIFVTPYQKSSKNTKLYHPVYIERQ